MSSFWLILKQQWTIKISSPLFSIFSLVAILVGSRDHRTQFWKGAIQGPFHQSLVAICPVVSEEKIKMWNVDGRMTDEKTSQNYELNKHKQEDTDGECIWLYEIMLYIFAFCNCVFIKFNTSFAYGVSRQIQRKGRITISSQEGHLYRYILYISVQYTQTIMVCAWLTKCVKFNTNQCSQWRVIVGQCPHAPRSMIIITHHVYKVQIPVTKE